MKPRSSKYSVVLFTSALAVAPPVLAQQSGDAVAPVETAPDCAARLAEMQSSIDEIGTRLEERRGEMLAAAGREPLLVTLSDGRIVWLGGEEELSEPYESWFVSEDELQRRISLTDEAADYLKDRKEAECIDALTGDHEQVANGGG
jgi:hypothetical protein